jgi:hypothetical protein
MYILTRTEPHRRYRELIINIESMLDELPQDRHVWKHLVGDGTKSSSRREASIDASPTTAAALGDARQATDAELLRLGTHTVECVTNSPLIADCSY